MVTSERLSTEELMIRMKERISELEKANEELDAGLLDRTRSEESLKEVYNVLNILEEKVKEYTAELDKYYNLLKESESSLAEAQKMAHVGNWDRNIATGEVHWSDEVYRIFGFEPQEFGVTYDVFLSFVHPDDRGYVIKAAKQALKEKLSSIDYRIVWSNGKERIVHEEIKVVFDEKNIPIQLKGTVQDISERKRAEQELIRTKEELAQRATDKYLMLFNSIDEGYALCEVIYDTDGKAADVRFLEVNPALERLSGLEDVLSKTARQLIPTIESTWIESAARVVETGKAFRFEGYVEGLGRWVDVHFSRVGNETSHTIAIVFNNATERKLTERRICRYNRVLEGINRIFSNIVQTKTEEELGNTCLSVALEVTGGGIGFINLFGDDGLMHYVSISNQGWDQCFMHDKTGHCCPPGSFEVHGLYGHVVNSEKGFFTNDPPSHPESIDLPHGHPPVNSFLGVPLVLDGKVMGTLGVANCEGGYSSEHQEDLEAIASAVMQALYRKRKEQEMEQVEEALRKSEETARQQLAEIENLYRNAPVGLCELDHELRYVRVNERLAEFNGFPVAAHIGKQIRDIIPQFANAMEPKMRHILETGEPLLNIEIAGNTFLQPNIERSWLEQWLPIFDAQGLVTGINIVVVETTERKKMEKELQESEEKYRNIVETANEGILIINDKAIITYANQKITDMLGYTLEEGIGRPIWDFLGEESKTIVKLNLESRQQNINQSYELKLISKDGLLVWVIVNAKALFDKNSKFIGSLSMLTDITEIKQTQEALIKREKEFRTLAENSPDMIARFDRQNRHIYVNPAVIEGYGLSSQEEIVGKTREELGLSPEMVKILEDHHKNVFDTKKPKTIEFEYISIQGKRYYLNTRTVPEFINGEVISVLDISQDITEQKKAEKELQLASKYNRRLIEASLDPLVTIGSDGKITDVNKATESITGYSRKELIGTDFSNYFTEPEKAKEGYKQVFREGLVLDYALEIQHRNGHITPVLYNACVYRDEDGEVIGIFAAARDITEHKKAQEKIRTLANVVESSNDAIITESLDGIIISWNKGAEQVYGYLAEEVLGKNMSILEPDNLKGEIKQLAERVKQGKKVKNHETLRLKKDGTILNISVTLSPIFNVSGKLVAISNIAGDITEKKISENLLHEKQMAEIANRTKSEFLANMSHELRTPLNSIIGFSDMLHEQAYGELNRKQLRAVGNISNSGKHLLNLINGILDLSKIEANKMELNYREFELATKLDLIRNVLYPIAEKKNIEIEIDMDKELTRIRADEEKFTRIMYNLVDNAIKFSYENSLVKVGARKKGDLVEITVRDNGIGIKAEDQHKLFKPFSQVNSFSSKKCQGTGLGLSLVKQIVNLHGGYVWFRSEEEEGSTFAFAIPIAAKVKIFASCH